jgi:hypothetical protein
MLVTETRLEDVVVVVVVLGAVVDELVQPERSAAVANATTWTPDFRPILMLPSGPTSLNAEILMRPLRFSFDGTLSPLKLHTTAGIDHATSAMEM